MSCHAAEDARSAETNNKATPLAGLYTVVPDIETCSEGKVGNEEKQKVLEALNRVRALHELKPVIYTTSGDVQVARAALIMLANKKLDHNPPKSSKCWSEEGLLGSSKSNLHACSIKTTHEALCVSEALIASFLKDVNVESLGHRRWLLNPFLGEISYGRADAVIKEGEYTKNDSYAALRVIDGNKGAISDTALEYVAYPYHDYPGELVNKEWYFSFSALADREDFWANGRLVNFSLASITMTAENGAPLEISAVSYNNNGFGLPDIVQWKAKDVRMDVKYSVKVRQVRVNGVPRDYEYWFRLVDAKQ